MAAAEASLPSAPAPHRHAAIAQAGAMILNAERVVDDRMHGNSVISYRGVRIGVLLSAEQMYLSNQERQERLIVSSLEVSFAVNAASVCRTVVEQTRRLHRTAPFNLNGCAHKVAYHSARSFVFDPPTRRLRAGGLREALYDASMVHVRAWLRAMREKIASHVRSLPTQPSRSATAHTEKTIDELARRLVRRTVLHGATSDAEGNLLPYEDPLGPEQLDALARGYFDRAFCAHGRAAKEWSDDRASVVALQTLISTVSESPSAARGAVEELGARANAALARPPPELQNALNRWPCALDGLRPIIGTSGFDPQVGADVAHDWSNTVEARQSAMACSNALAAFDGWTAPSSAFLHTIDKPPKEAPGYTEQGSVARPDGSARHHAPLFVPPTKHASLFGTYVLVRTLPHARAVRSGLRAEAEVDVRLISSVWQLLHHFEELPIGVMSAHEVHLAATRCYHESLHVKSALCEEQVAEGLHIGPTLHVTADELLDLDGQFAEVVADASRAVCRESITDLFETLQRSDVAELTQIGRLMQPLLIGVRGAVVCSGDLHPQYVLNTLGLTIPSIAEQRSRMRIGPTMPINPFLADMAKAIGPVSVGIALGNMRPLRLPVRALGCMSSEVSSALVAAADAESSNDVWGNRLRLVTRVRRPHRKGEVAQIEIRNLAALAGLMAQVLVTDAPTACADEPMVVETGVS